MSTRALRAVPGGVWALGFEDRAAPQTARTLRAPILVAMNLAYAGASSDRIGCRFVAAPPAGA